MFNKFRKVIPKPDENAEKTLQEEIEENGGLEKKDLPAMIISAYLVFLPVIIGLFLLFVLVAWLFLGI